MPALKNGRWELFAQGLAAKKTAEVAYAEAGYNPNPGNATRLKLNEAIKARVAELLANSARRVEVTLEKLFRDLEEVRVAALAAKQFGPVVSALREMAVLAQLRVEKVDNTTRFEDADKISDDELLRIARGNGDEEPTKEATFGDTTRH